jgi:thiol-disulfide isomerase/thioredoxin
MSPRILLFGALALATAAGCTSQSDDLTSASPEHPHALEGFIIQDAKPVELPAADADKLIADMLALFRSGHGFRVKGTLWQVGLSDDGRYLPSLQMPSKERTFRLEKPNLATCLPGDEAGPQISSDGKDLVIYLPSNEKVLIRDPAPKSPLELLRHPELNALGHPMMFFPFHLASDETMDMMFGDTFQKTVVAGEEIDGQPAYHVSLKNEDVDGRPGLSWHIWLPAKGRPLPMQVRFDLGKQTVEREDKSHAQAMLALLDRYTDWELDPATTAGEFQFETPSGARQVLSLYEQNSPFIGKQAAPFSLERLEGGTATLAAHAGKDVVVLDFWASWCGPCLQAMPYVDRIARDYEGRGVVFYSVNVGEPKDDVRKFMEQAKLGMQVLLDPDKTLSKAYEDPSLPTMVIIDKQGTILAVNQGFNPVLDWLVRKQLDAQVGPPPADKTLNDSSSADAAQAPPVESKNP